MGKRVLFGIEAGGLLALLSFPAAALLLVFAGGFDPAMLLILATPPCLAAFGFMLAVLFVPDMAGDLKFRMPMNITYPIAFAVINLTVTRAFWFSPSVVLSPHAALEAMQLWFDPRLILLTLVIQVIGLSVACYGNREPAAAA